LAEAPLQIAGGVGGTEHLGQGVDHVIRGGELKRTVTRRLAEDLVTDVVQRR
jgi:hypothetical protein